MTEKVSLKVSAAAAAYVAKDAPQAEKLRAARGEAPLAGADLASVLLFLCHDTDPEVKNAALASLRTLPEDLLSGICTGSFTHPRMLDLLARLHWTNPSVVAMIVANQATDEKTLEFLAEKGCLAGGQAAQEEGEESGEEPGEVDEESETYKNKYQMYLSLGVSEKIKYALTGDKEWRSLLIKDSNKLVSSAVIKNPRITDAEVLAISKSKVQNDEVIRAICANREWVKIYPVKKALVENCKTPLPLALRFMTVLTEKDLAYLAKSKNVSSIISTQARKLLMAKDKK